MLSKNSFQTALILLEKRVEQKFQTHHCEMDYKIRLQRQMIQIYVADNFR